MENECRRLAWIDARDLRRSTQVADEDAARTLIETRYRLDLDAMRRLATLNIAARAARAKAEGGRRQSQGLAADEDAAASR